MIKHAISKIKSLKNVEFVNPASREELNLKSKALQIELPQSYIDLISISNGFNISNSIYANFLPISKIDYFRNSSPISFSIWSKDKFDVSDENYFVYGEDQDTVNYRAEYLDSCLQVSEEFDGMVILLNPKIVFNGEWEVWVLASWYPGAARYRGLNELLIEIYDLESTHRVE